MRTRIQAEFIVVEPNLVLSDAQIVVQNGKVLELCEYPSLQPDVILPRTTLLPGFINAHTHLEFSDFLRPMPKGSTFPDWIAAVVRHRRQQQQQFEFSELLGHRMKSIALGLTESWRCGVAGVVDIVTPPWSYQHLGQELKSHCASLSARPLGSVCEQPITLIALAELLGMDSDRFDQSWTWARDLSTTFATSGEDQDQSRMCVWDKVGFSPHATYSLIHPLVAQRLREVSQNTLVAMHVAESQEELHWLERATGPFRELFQRLDFDLTAPRMSVEEAIDMLGRFDRSLLIHGNYLSGPQLDRLSRKNIAIVYCPRTHRHFAHRSYPLPEIRSREISWLLGTDSRASNPDLSIWKECCEARAVHPSLSGPDALASVTIRAASFLGISDRLGSLYPGKDAWINHMPTPLDATTESLLDLAIRTDQAHPVPLG